MDIGFTHPEYMWFLISVPILIAVHFISIKYLRRKAFIFANFKAVARVLGSSQDLSVNTLPVMLRAFVLFVLTLAVSGLYIQDYVMRTDVDFVMALDLSSSMMASDYSPNRLAAAKQAMIAFTQSLDGLQTSVGLVYFSGIAQTGVVPTSDMSAVRKSLEETEVSSVGGTAIGDAIILASDKLRDSKRGRVVILLTDGQSNVGSTPLTAINFAKANGIVVHTIGVGTPQGGAISDSDLLSKLDETTLQTIASETGARYLRVTSPAQMSSALSELAAASKDRVSTDITPYLLLLGLSVLIVEWLFVNTKYRTLP